MNLGDDSTFIIAPNDYIVGNLHGKQLKVCNGSKDHPKECHPNGLFDFTKGDVIDFTWGMSDGQVGKLEYDIVENDYHDELRKRTSTTSSSNMQ